MCKLGLTYIWEEVYIDKGLYTIIENRFYDVYRQEMMSNIHQVYVRRYTYQHLVDSFCMQYYLLKPIDICKNILPDLECLHIAWTLNMAVIEMNCEKIDYVLSVTKMILRMNFILFINVLSIATYIKPYYYRNPSVFKLLQLLSVQNVKELRNLGKYLCCACLICNTIAHCLS